MNDHDWKALAQHYETALHHLSLNAFAEKDWLYARDALTSAPESAARDEDLRDTISAIFKAVGYTEEYARQWPKEKASVTFKRWFDERVAAARASSPAGQAQPSTPESDYTAVPGPHWGQDGEPLPGNPLLESAPSTPCERCGTPGACASMGCADAVLRAQKDAPPGRPSTPAAPALMNLDGMAHRMCSKYEHHHDPAQRLYCFRPNNLSNFADAVIRAARASAPEGAAEGLTEAVERLADAYKHATGGVWHKGLTTHHTVTDLPNAPRYKIGEFHHADDANFCDVAHEVAPILIAAIEQSLRPSSTTTGESNG